MYKKLFASLLCFSALTAYADSNTNTIPATSTTPPTNSKELNNPVVGSRQAGSEQIFGEPKITGQKSKKPNTPTNSTEANNPIVGGRQAGSEQIFGEPKITGTPGKTYSKPQKSGYEANNPDVGGRQAGSEQLFGQSAGPNGNTPDSK